jgi:uncharacterized protein
MSYRSVPRRTVLKVLASSPLIPLAASLGSKCVFANNQTSPVSISFTHMPSPSSVAEKTAVYTQSNIVIKYADGKTSTKALSYQMLYSTGDLMKTPSGKDIIAGGYFNVAGEPIMDRSGDKPEQFYSDCPDGTSLIQLKNAKIKGMTGNPVFVVTQFEYKTASNGGEDMYAKLPSQIAIVTADQNKSTGLLTAKHYFNIPTSHIHGIWISCAASLSPWNTHLSSEEYEPDAWLIDNHIDSKSLTLFKTFSKNTFGQENAARPYWYGHVPEVTVHTDGTGSIKKHYCLGRISRELTQVMPDQRTVLMGDDATSGGIFMFIADKARDLSSGTLYVAKMDQVSSEHAGKFAISWIKLGHATSAEIEAFANQLTAKDIMAVSITDPNDHSFTKINFGNIATTGKNPGTGQQWVKFKPGMNQAAAFLETRRYAAAMGATMELTKFEGVTLNAKDKKAYFAISDIRDTMTKNGFASDSIQIAKNNAGATYEVTLATNHVIGSDWVPSEMFAPQALIGETLAQADSDGNTSVIEKISNPDNLKYSASMRTLFIGEDSGKHLNNYVWAYNVDTKELSRILSVPAGAECVCLQAVDNLNGFSYIMSGFQHAGDWKFNAHQHELDQSIRSAWGNRKKAAIGYISGLPIIK